MKYTVYKLLINQNYYYIGCTSNTKKRHNAHMFYLKRNEHANKHMQKLYNDNNSISVEMHILKQFNTKKEALNFERTTLHQIGDNPLCLNVIATSEQKEWMAIAQIGKPRSESIRRKIAESKKGIPAPKAQCPHCNKIGGIAAMHRHHFNNCKLKNIQS